MEYGLGLTTISSLLTVVTTLSLSEKRSLTSLVLGDLVGSVLFALSSTESATGLGNVHLWHELVWMDRELKDYHLHRSGAS